MKKIYTLGVKKAIIGLQSPKTEFEAQNQYGRVIIHHSGFLHGVRKYILLEVIKAKIGPRPKTKFRAQNQYGRVIHPSIGNLTWSKKIFTFGGLKGENRPPEPKTEFGVQNQYGRVIYLSIGNFTWSKKTYIFRGQKGKNGPPEPKNGIWGPKSVWSCDISIDRKSYMEQEKIYFKGSKMRK
jgi:hypothetical protein